MKRLILFCLILNVLAINTEIKAQTEYANTGLLGDNFSLEGALEIFKNASSMEDFEELINREDQAINNLDLNDDGYIDYIRVEDHMDGDVHAIVLQAVFSEYDYQDIAVIEIEKTGIESATIQIVGDKYLYDDAIYVEPFYEETSSTDYTRSRVAVNVWAWPSVRYVYRPNYAVYRSPFRWRAYPTAWKPWRPLTWNVYHSKRQPYYQHYHPVSTHRVVKARKIYTPVRKTSKVVVVKSKTVRKANKNNKGNTVVKQNTKTTKVKKSKDDNVKNKKVTKVKKVKKKSGN